MIVLGHLLIPTIPYACVKAKVSLLTQVFVDFFNHV